MLSELENTVEKTEELRLSEAEIVVNNYGLTMDPKGLIAVADYYCGGDINYAGWCARYGLSAPHHV